MALRQPTGMMPAARGISSSWHAAPEPPRVSTSGAGSTPRALLRSAAAPASMMSLANAGMACAAGLLGVRFAKATHRLPRRRAAGKKTALAAQPDPEVDPRPQKDEPAKVPPVQMPMISTAKGNIDVMSRLLQDRILILSGQVNDEMANVLIAQMLYLANQDGEKDITIYINSPGGSVSAGLAIYDSMQFVPCDVNTVCFGMAASMGAFLLGAGTKGKRKCLPNSRVMIHQPLGGAGGQAADMEIQAKEILFLRDILNTYLADFTGKPIEKIAEDCDRDYFMTPEEAVTYGIIDEVVATKSWPRLQKPPKPTL